MPPFSPRRARGLAVVRTIAPEARLLADAETAYTLGGHPSNDTGLYMDKPDFQCRLDGR